MRSGTISLNHNRANNVPTTMTNQAGTGSARAANRASTVAAGTVERPPTSAKVDNPSTATHTRNNGPNWTEKA